MKVSEILKNIEDIKNELSKLEHKRAQLVDQKLIYDMQLSVLDKVDFEFTAAYDLVTSYFKFNVAYFEDKYKPTIYSHHLKKLVEELSKGNVTYLNDENYLCVWVDRGVSCDTYKRVRRPAYGDVVAIMESIKPIDEGILLTLIKALKVLIRDENLVSIANLERPITLVKFDKMRYIISK